MIWVAGILAALLILAAFLVRRDESKRADARRRNPRPLPYLDEPWGDQ